MRRGSPNTLSEKELEEEMEISRKSVTDMGGNCENSKRQL
jgi:hypothetical protein